MFRHCSLTVTVQGEEGELHDIVPGRVRAVEEGIACKEVVVYMCEALGLHIWEETSLVLSRSGVPHKKIRRYC